MFHVYVLENREGMFYVGQSCDLDKRLSEHNEVDTGSGKFTHKHGPWRLVYSEEHATRSAAVARERFIKSRKSSTWIRQHLPGRASPDVHRD